jgi:hypothetical protein
MSGQRALFSGLLTAKHFEEELKKQLLYYVYICICINTLYIDSHHCIIVVLYVHVDSLTIVYDDLAYM